MSKAIGYIRVSSADQNAARQLEGVTLDKVFTEKVSGKSTSNRPALAACLDYLRDGDTLHVHSIDRLARNLADLQSIVAELTSRGVAVRFEKQGLCFSGEHSDPMQTLMLQMLGAFAEFERELIHERQREGIAAAKASGKHLGRPAALTVAQCAEIQQRKADGETATALADEYGVSRQTLYQALKAG